MSFSVLLRRILSLFDVILSIFKLSIKYCPVHSDAPEDCHVVAGSSARSVTLSTPDLREETVTPDTSLLSAQLDAKESPERLGWTDAQIKVLRKLGGCAERNPSTRTANAGTHSDVSTPKRCIKIDDEQLLKAPYRAITPPMNDSNFLDQKVWSPLIEWDEWDVPYFRVSGYLFNQGTVWLYTRDVCEMFWQGYTPYIQFHAEDWAYFRNKICKELTSVENCMEGAYIAQWNGSINGETYRVETEMEVYDPTSRIFFRQCMDKHCYSQGPKGYST